MAKPGLAEKSTQLREVWTCMKEELEDKWTAEGRQGAEEPSLS